MLKKDWLELPEEIKIFVSEEIEIITHRLVEKFELDGGQEVFILDLIDDVVLKKVKVLDLANKLDKMPNAKDVDIRLLALDLAYKVFWLLQDYLGEVDRLILRLGGKVPRQKTLRIKETVKDDGIFKGTEEDTVHNMLDRYNDFINLRLTTKKIINKDGRTVSPTIENWIEDYVHFLGAGNHNSLKRARYLSKALNVLDASKKDREKLRHFFVSYDEHINLFFHIDKGVLSIDEFQNKKDEKVIVKNTEFDAVEVLNNFHKELLNLKSSVIPGNIIMSEAEEDTVKVRDVLWRSIGIGDKDKTISCLALLIEKKAFDLMIKEDNRFKSILKRFIGIKYGQGMERSLDENIDHLIMRRVFLEMILVDKLNLTEKELFVVIFYLTNIVPGSGQLIYLDEKDQKFKWRIIQVSGNKFTWVDSII